MARGRCAGCGFEDLSCKKVDRHTAGCPEFLALYRRDPKLALDPEAAYAKAHSEDAEAEAAFAKEERAATLKAWFQNRATERQQRAQERWRTVVNHRAEQVAMPEDGSLPNVGRTPAQVELLKTLTGASA